MVKVITYGTFDFLHFGHIRLLERAKQLGDYLVVGITADDFDKNRGKINVHQSLSERIEAVRKLEIADEIIVEEYEGQKIDDIRRLNIDVFTVGSDWRGYFDYLEDYCKVVYLDRTKGISSTEIRQEKRSISLGLVGNSKYLNKVINEAAFVNGLKIVAICTELKDKLDLRENNDYYITDNYNYVLDKVDAVYIHSHPDIHYEQVKQALKKGVHVLCESPIALNKNQCKELLTIANDNNLILTEGLRTAYSTAYERLLLLVKTGKIGKVVSIDATCTSLKNFNPNDNNDLKYIWNSMTAWAPTALLPVFQILGTKYRDYKIVSHILNDKFKFDDFSQISFVYPEAVANVKVGIGVKSEGELLISGTRGYVYVPSPWWKTDYFELRYENPLNNKRYFYQLDGEGIRYELVTFLRAIEENKNSLEIENNVTMEISDIMNSFYNKINLITI